MPARVMRTTPPSTINPNARPAPTQASRWSRRAGFGRVALLTWSGDCAQGFNDVATEFPQQLTQCGYGLFRRRPLERFGQVALFDAEDSSGSNVAKDPARGQFSAPGRVRLETQHFDLHLISEPQIARPRVQ